MVKFRLSVPVGKGYAFFVDLKSAFDGVNRDILVYNLLSVSISNLLRDLDTEISATVCAKDGRSGSFHVDSGIMHSCLISPLLFALSINDIFANIPHGIKVGAITVQSLFCADDLVIFAEKPEDIKENINDLDKYCQEWQIFIKMTMFNVMIFQSYEQRTAREH